MSISLLASLQLHGSVSRGANSLRDAIGLGLQTSHILCSEKYFVKVFPELTSCKWDSQGFFGSPISTLAFGFLQLSSMELHGLASLISGAESFGKQD